MGRSAGDHGSARFTLYYLAFSVTLAHGIVITLLSLYLNAMGYSGSQIGLFNAGFTVASALASWAAGRISASRGYVTALLLSLVPPAALAPLFPLAMTPLITVTAVLVYGLSKGAFGTAAVGLLSEIPGRWGAAVSFGAFYTAVVLGRTVSGALAGAIIEGLGYPYLLLAGGLLMAAAAPLALILRGKVGSRGAGRVKRRGEGPKSSRKPSKSMIILLVALFLHTMGFMAVSPFFSLYALKELGLSEGLVGTLMSIRSAGVMVSEIAAGYLTTAAGSAEVLAAHVLLSSLSWSTFTLSSGFWSAAAILLFGGVVGALDMPARRTLISELSAPGEERARSMGLVDAVTGVASAVGYLLGGAMWDRLGPQSPFLIASVYNAAAVPLLLLLRRRRAGEASA
ncbi:MAG: MFS transporter [Candidatus Korarchaeota archaeon]|nr:MFS transporter [Candidatus Korarchaeota archaeon]